MVPSDPFMSHLATQPEYFAGEFQALQLIVLAAFGVMDYNMVGVAVAMVIPTMHEKLCIDLHNAW